MANTMTNVLPVAYKAARIVPRLLVGAVASVDTTFDAKFVAKGDTVKVPVIGVGTETDYTPAMTTTAGDNTTPSTVSLTMDYSKERSWHLTGEEIQSLQNAGDIMLDFQQQKIQGEIEVLVRAMEGRVTVALKQGASRATGTAGTTPFATTIDSLVDAQQILNDNGTPLDMRYVVLTSAAAAKLKKLVTINNQPAGSPAEEMLRGGTMVNLHGFNIRESSNIAIHVIGTASGTQFSATEPIGETSLAYDTDTDGPWTAGDVVTFGSGGGSGTADTNKYIVNAANTATPLIINTPGLRLAHVDNDVMTVGSAYTPSFAFHKSALKLVSRVPFIPSNANFKTSVIQDPVSGLAFMFSEITGDGMITYRLNIVYGIKVIQSDFIAAILG